MVSKRLFRKLTIKERLRSKKFTNLLERTSPYREVLFFVSLHEPVMEHSAKVLYLLLGSNLGDRLSVLALASDRIGERIGPVVRTSGIYETAPWGVTDQPSFLNQVLAIRTSYVPEEVLRLILDIEHELGRVRYERWGARVIDIDILFYEDLVLDSARLTVPHPRLHERRFTLVPLVEIAPDLIHPVLHKPLTQLLNSCTDSSEVNAFSGENV
jgi:2-amino-4-hydroxy-6-hydroxymethyldihydropteridine diphosphokinase